MILAFLRRLAAYQNRSNSLKVAKSLQKFSIKEKRLFRGEIIAAGDGGVNLKTCSIVIGDGTMVLCRVFFERDNTFLRVGKNSFIGASDLVVSAGISVGDNVLISHGCLIQDHDSHSTEAALRRADVKAWVEGRPKDWSSVKCSPIAIEDDVWIGARAILLKGVTIGHDSIVAAAAVVTKDVAPFTTVAGNPARGKES